MSTLDQKPTFNLKAVLQETGLKADTLRAWERRYGLPRPERTAGGHRLYSQRDIDTIKWLAARQGEGMRISQAVDLWHNLETDRQDPLQVMEFTTSGAAPAPISLPEGETMAEIDILEIRLSQQFAELLGYKNADWKPLLENS